MQKWALWLNLFPKISQKQDEKNICQISLTSYDKIKYYKQFGTLSQNYSNIPNFLFRNTVIMLFVHPVMLNTKNTQKLLKPNA